MPNDETRSPKEWRMTKSERRLTPSPDAQSQIENRKSKIHRLSSAHASGFDARMG
jgi:hypothetical protein